MYKVSSCNPFRILREYDYVCAIENRNSRRALNFISEPVVVNISLSVKYKFEWEIYYENTEMDLATT